MQYGDLEGKSLTDPATLQALRGLWKAWRGDTGQPCPGPGSESIAELAERASAALWDVARECYYGDAGAAAGAAADHPDHPDQSGQPHVALAAVVGHSMFLRAAVAAFAMAAGMPGDAPRTAGEAARRLGRSVRGASSTFMKTMDAVQLGNGSVTVVDFDCRRGALGAPPAPVVRIVNFMGHLGASGRAASGGASASVLRGARL